MFCRHSLKYRHHSKTSIKNLGYSLLGSVLPTMTRSYALKNRFKRTMLRDLFTALLYSNVTFKIPGKQGDKNWICDFGSPFNTKVRTFQIRVSIKNLEEKMLVDFTLQEKYIMSTKIPAKLQRQYLESLIFHPKILFSRVEWFLKKRYGHSACCAKLF